MRCRELCAPGGLVLTACGGRGAVSTVTPSGASVVVLLSVQRRRRALDGLPSRWLMASQSVPRSPCRCWRREARTHRGPLTRRTVTYAAGVMVFSGVDAQCSAGRKVAADTSKLELPNSTRCNDAVAARKRTLISAAPRRHCHWPAARRHSKGGTMQSKRLTCMGCQYCPWSLLTLLASPAAR